MPQPFKTNLTAKVLRKLVIYDPETGIFVSRSKQGLVSFYNNGYLILRVKGTDFHAHRLAWLYVHGHWPADQLDHRNRIKDDNRLENLREASQGQNGSNIGLRKSNTSGYKGVYWQKNTQKWVAQISYQNNVICLGRFQTREEAALVYDAAALHYFDEFALTNKMLGLLP